MKAVHPDDGEPDAVPGIAAEGPDAGDVPTFTLEVDGERFAVRTVVDASTGYTDTGYTWLSGPNDGHGFGIGGPPNPSREEHRRRIRQFLAMVDPASD